MAADQSRPPARSDERDPSSYRGERRPNARQVALEVLRTVQVRDAYANLLLPPLLDESGLTQADRAYATELSYGTLRMLGLYDEVIERAARRDLDTIDPEVLDVLRLGAHQWLELATGAHAVVNESVVLADRSGLQRARGFINAVLRRVTEHSRTEWIREVTADAHDAVDAASIEFSHPRWIVESIAQALQARGRAGELGRALDADNVPPRVTLADIAELAVGDEAVAGSEEFVSPVAQDAPAGDPAEIADVREGRMRVQDAGSQLAALTLTRARPVESGERWLDLTAGPGGKTVILAAEASRSEISVVANEVVPHRARLVREALEQSGFDVPVLTADGRDIAEASEAADGFDRILLDAPCTGIGALRRRPEARWRKSPDDVETLSLLQTELIDSAVSVLRPGGVLAYVTCSPHPVETTDQVASALVRHPDLELLDAHAIAARIAPRSLARDAVGDVVPVEVVSHTVQLWPHTENSDAMFIALLQRRSTRPADGVEAGGPGVVSSGEGSVEA